jgi:hypothetical protein
MSKAPKRWQRLLLEGGAVVASILLAFAIDAWWADLGEARREREILVDLRAEFEANRTGLDAQAGHHHENADAALRLYAIATGIEREAERPMLDSLLDATLLAAGSLNLAQGVYSSIVSSGDVGLIEDDSLRYALGSWPGVLEDALEDEVWIWEDVQERFVPFLVHRAPLSSVMRFDLEADRAILSDEVPFDYTSLLSDRAFQNYLVYKAWNERFAAAAVLRASDSARQVLRLIDRRLGLGPS